MQRTRGGDLPKPDALCVIPARGGSRGIPRKNVRVVGGKPLVAHAIEQALEARTVGRVVVSTDDAEIASVARRHGSEVVERPAELARSLLSEGYTAMKVWPFDAAAEASRGQDLPHAELRAGMRILEAIRAEVGDAMDLLVELHGL